LLVEAINSALGRDEKNERELKGGRGGKNEKTK